ncbi:MAG: sigma-54-dependent Fis family transcriptional regulator, partial [Candidatus Eisenbacteria sp.]|nr:sigma-54-dependent Fis family transcriptional regulator [Candidatus Eisenbacteria bacterium]
SQVNSPVLITGKSGTGKEVLARFIHQQSPRARKPFVAVNCAAIPEGLFESELFGRERGAYTGAITARRGSFELAEGGTLFLDEIAEMPPALQPKLLRVLQSGEYSQIGSERLRSADARVLCSTNADPHEAISSRRLREDLFYRINVVTLYIPPLSERREDVLVLAKHFLELKCQELGRNVEGFTPAAESLLLTYHWPGNARELENLIERAMVFCRSSRIEADLLSPICEGAPFLDLPWEQARERAMMRFERSYLAALLHVHHGVASLASEAMGVTRQTFYRALKRAGLKAEDFR